MNYTIGIVTQDDKICRKSILTKLVDPDKQYVFRGTVLEYVFVITRIQQCGRSYVYHMAHRRRLGTRDMAQVVQCMGPCNMGANLVYVAKCYMTINKKKRGQLRRILTTFATFQILRTIAHHSESRQVSNVRTAEHFEDYPATQIQNHLS